MSDLWTLPAEPGTVIAIGGWWLVRLEPHNGTGPGCWELLPAATEEIRLSMERARVKAQCVYSDEWVLTEAEQEGGYYVVSAPVNRQYGPHIRYRLADEASSSKGMDS